MFPFNNCLQIISLKSTSDTNIRRDSREIRVHLGDGKTSIQIN